MATTRTTSAAGPPHTTGQGRADKRQRIRLSPEERLDQIVTVATELVARTGFYGLSLQSVADGVGITQAGLLHYVGNKAGLLELLLNHRYDKEGTPADFVAAGSPEATHPEGVSLPAYFRYLVGFNARRPTLMQLHMVLGAEASDPAHPAHQFFVNRPDQVWDFYRATTWRLPHAIMDAGGFGTLRPLVEMSIEAMDGIQVRYFRRPPVNLADEWARFEELLFPSPLWDGYR